VPDRVLVVEDDDTIRKLLVEYLKNHSDVTVTSARDGVEALHRISRERFAVVILDVMMPYMSGIDLLDSLKALASDPSLGHIEHLPAVLVITAASEATVSDNEITKRFPRVVRAIFRKPLDMAIFAESVQRYLEVSPR